MPRTHRSRNDPPEVRICIGFIRCIRTPIDQGITQRQVIAHIDGPVDRKHLNVGLAYHRATAGLKPGMLRFVGTRGTPQPHDQKHRPNAPFPHLVHPVDAPFFRLLLDCIIRRFPVPPSPPHPGTFSGYRQAFTGGSRSFLLCFGLGFW